MTDRAITGSPGQEMFFGQQHRPYQQEQHYDHQDQQQPSQADSPLVKPLRIQKSATSSPESRNGSPAQTSKTRTKPSRTYSPPPGAGEHRIAKTRLPYPVDNLNDDEDNEASSAVYGASVSSNKGYRRQHMPEAQPPTESRPSGSGSRTKPLPDSPGPALPDKEGLFQRMPNRSNIANGNAKGKQQNASSSSAGGDYNYKAQYFPPPTEQTRPSQSALHAPEPNAMNRFSSTASTSTTKAQRGSPPPPETPVGGSAEDPFGGGIEARYAAAGIAGANTLNNLHSAAAAQRAHQYAHQQPSVSAEANQSPLQRRPWTPTEPAVTQPLPSAAAHHANHPSSSSNHGRQGSQTAAADLNHGLQDASTGQTQTGLPRSSGSHGSRTGSSALEQDIQRLQVSGSPPPAYSSVHKQAGGASQGAGQLTEKNAAAGRSGASGNASATGPAIASTRTSKAPSLDHPAFANDPRPDSTTSHQTPGPQATPLTIDATQANASPPGSTLVGPASPPPLPEGWIAHIDPNSGQYYYIHLPTQSTQWEFPKGPTPLNLHEPTSPQGGTFSAFHLQSPVGSTHIKPGQTPMNAGYAESVMSVTSAAPTITGFTGPPPSSGVDLYKVAPTNGVYFGPYLRYTNMDIERGIWYGSILLVTDAPQPPTIHLHQSVDLSPNPRQLKANAISKHQRWTFYRYSIDIAMEEHGSAKWTYAITSHLGCTRYEFLVAGRHDTNWRFIATSGNDFALNVSVNERARLGGLGVMWKDIMQKHTECGGFHAQLGMGNQIYADRMWREIPLLKQWLIVSGKENRKNDPWTAAHEEEVSHAYFHYYTSHFDQPFLREAFAQIPYMLQIDDHDIFDGFGSYPEYMQFSNMFKNIGRIGIDTYLLFQHHTTLELLRNVSNDFDIFTITGTGWHFVKYLGPAVVIVGPDCRSERNPNQVMAGPTYQGIFPKIATLPPTVQHCIWMIPVPIIYPRLETIEQLGNAVATGKKAVTGAYNVLGKVTSSVAGVVGAKQAVGSGFDQVKRAIGKSGLMGNMLSPFGDVGMMDELRDAWTHESKDLERTYLIRTLQGIAHQKALRMTFLSGSVDCCGAGLVHDPYKPQDHKTMYQLISSSVVNAPPGSYLLRLLHQTRPLYVPANGQRSTNQPSDTKEDMMEIFQTEPDGRARDYKRLMARRNYIALVAFDPDSLVGGSSASTIGSHSVAASGLGGGLGVGLGGGLGNGVAGYGLGQAGNGSTSGADSPSPVRLSLAADFLVQGDSGVAGVSKYGPVIIPSLEFGR